MLKPKIRVIIKRPDEKYGHVTNISRKLENLQKTVGGYIETIPFRRTAGGEIIIICNEEGKLQNLEPNFILHDDVIVGTVIVCGVDVANECFGDLPNLWGLAEWKAFIDSGNHN